MHSNILHFLDQYKKAHKGTKISALSTTVLAPLGIYSDKIKDVQKVKDGAKVVIPNDVSNQARALKLLEAAGLIKLKKRFRISRYSERYNVKSKTFKKLLQ